MKTRFLRVLLALALCCAISAAWAQEQPATVSAAAKGVTLAPYLAALSPDTVVIQWRTAQPAYGWVEYGETTNMYPRQEAAVLNHRQDTEVNGLRLANVKHHRVVLSGLRPGTIYWYRVGCRPIRSFGAYKVEFDADQYSEPTQFRTLPGPKQPVRAVVFNDLHNGLDTFRALCQVVGNTPFDFSFFNGDCLADPGKEDQVLTSLAAFTQGAQAANRPAFFTRGNHETRGAYARDLPGLLAWPSNKPYFSFDAGPVHFLVLDCGEDKSDDHKEYSGLVDFASFRREETEWLKTELASRAFRKAKWRVLINHIPLYPTIKAGGNSQPCQELWAGMLAKARIDIALNAHLHHAAFHPAGTCGNPYPLVIGGGNRLKEATVMFLEVDDHHLKLRVLDAEGKEALPAFEKKK